MNKQTFILLLIAFLFVIVGIKIVYLNKRLDMIELYIVGENDL